MRRLLSLGVLSLATLLPLAVPSTSQAQTPFGINLSVGNSRFSFSEGYRSYYPRYYPSTSFYYSQPRYVEPYIVAPRPAYIVQPQVIVQPYQAYPVTPYYVSPAPVVVRPYRY